MAKTLRRPRERFGIRCDLRAQVVLREPLAASLDVLLHAALPDRGEPVSRVTRAVAASVQIERRSDLPAEFGATRRAFAVARTRGSSGAACTRNASSSSSVT